MKLKQTTVLATLLTVPLLIGVSIKSPKVRKPASVGTVKMSQTPHVFLEPVRELDFKKEELVKQNRKTSETTKLVFLDLPQVNESERFNQAKELLGKHYSRSVVKHGEQIAGIESYIKNLLRERLPKKYRNKSTALASKIVRVGNQYELDPIFILSVIENESYFDVNAIGGVGEIGLMQIRPETAQWISKKYKLGFKNKKDLFNPFKNIQIGAAFLHLLREKHDNHSRLYLSAYNMGSKNVNRALSRKIWPKDYAVRVMQYYVKNYEALSKPSEFLASEALSSAVSNSN